MTTAENIKLLHDGGYVDQAKRMAESESTSKEFDEIETAYYFADGSYITFAYEEAWTV